MSQLRWIDKTQPQTLMMATLIMYINAAFGLLDGMVVWFPLGTVLVVGQVAAAIGIANEKKWGYWLGVVLTALFLAYIILHFSFFAIINLLFGGALLALLLHPQSREYRRVWFRW
ncbi:MAG: hypothetical protein JO337_10890 [Acidimicrobiales bacterium]|nr:hypothetical protein [Acidimicrobiales bacterium]